MARGRQKTPRMVVIGGGLWFAAAGDTARLSCTMLVTRQWTVIEKNDAGRVFVPWDEIDVRWPLLRRAA